MWNPNICAGLNITARNVRKSSALQTSTMFIWVSTKIKRKKYLIIPVKLVFYSMANIYLKYCANGVGQKDEIYKCCGTVWQASSAPRPGWQLVGLARWVSTQSTASLWCCTPTTRPRDRLSWITVCSGTWETRYSKTRYRQNTHLNVRNLWARHPQQKSKQAPQRCLQPQVFDPSMYMKSVIKSFS